MLCIRDSYEGDSEFDGEPNRPHSIVSDYRDVSRL